MTRLLQNIKEIDEAIVDARGGLTDELFYLVSRLTPLVNVDLLVKNDRNETLLTWREDQYYGPGWHVPGGIVRFKERWEDRINAVALRELGAEVLASDHPISIKQLFAPNRDVRGHFISLLFECRLKTPLDQNKCATNALSALNGQWLWHKSFPKNMIWQHKIYETFI